MRGRRAGMLCGLALCWVVACGEDAPSPPPTPTVAAGGGGQGGTGGAWPEDPCLSPSGFRACGIEGQCPVAGCGEDACWGQTFASMAGSTALSVCDNGAILAPDIVECSAAPDGWLCLPEHPSFPFTSQDGFAVPFEVGQLFLRLGAGDEVTYADLSPFTGEPILDGEGCPADTTLPFCGGSCAPCPEGSVCHGRSATRGHGYCKTGPSDCVADDPPAPGVGCLFFDHPSDPIAQARADVRGQILPVELCELLAEGDPYGTLRCVSG